MSPEISALLKSLILPPGANLLLCLLALCLLKNHRRIAMALLLIALGSLYLFATPLFSRLAAGSIETFPPLALETPGINRAGSAIVILGCGRYSHPPEYSEDDISACGLVRLRYAAEIQPVLQLPILISGGRVFGEPIAEASIMGRILEQKFGIPVRWLETDSRNTIENVRYSSAILQDNDIETVYLVTHSLHMQRSVRLFRHHGFSVIAAPTYFYSSVNAAPGWLDLLPSAAALSLTGMVFKEYLGILWQTVSTTSSE